MKTGHQAEMKAQEKIKSFQALKPVNINNQ